MKTVDVDCAMAAGDWEVWGIVDKDSAGLNPVFANDGEAFQFTVAGAVTSEPTDPGATNSPTFRPTGVTAEPTGAAPAPAPAPAAAAYALLHVGSYCESDPLREGSFSSDVIQLPNVRHQTTRGVESNIQLCAAQVMANRAVDGGCSTLFHTGGATGICACVRLGYMCDEDESEIGQSIFIICLNPSNPASCPNAMGFIDLQKVNEAKQLMLAAPQTSQEQENQQQSGTTGFELYGVPVLYYFLAMLCGVISGMAVYYIACGVPRKQNDLTEDFYHIALDTQEQE